MTLTDALHIALDCMNEVLTEGSRDEQAKVSIAEAMNTLDDQLTAQED